MFYKLLLIIIAAFFIWRLFVYFKTNPQAFSKVNINRSIFTLGILALLLIGFVAVLVFVVKR